ncbi:hypothetical protein H4Q32_005837 [Labeo rohita]|uniref:Uncharacterized protein n=1 Tax=Labeo rohita TaxID=84645 RepID=A0ABQ8LQR1_LABRO|nr:hypothetical protein H4Q32_005837 [Labeo rohita]
MYSSTALAATRVRIPSHGPVPIPLPSFSAQYFPQQKNLEGYVGFANLPNQVYRKSVKRGFEFTLMVVGE